MFSSYKFDNMTRINTDTCYLDQQSIQNTNNCNYRLQNFFANDCSMKTPINLATTQPGILYKGGHNLGAGGCNVDVNSKLTIGSIQDNPKHRIDLFHRPFSTIPYLGRGTVNPDIEFQIKQGDSFSNRKTQNNFGENSYLNYQQTPLLKSVQEQVNNPSRMIEGIADDGWIRGGVPSRELTRDTEYFNQSN